MDLGSRNKEQQKQQQQTTGQLLSARDNLLIEGAAAYAEAEMGVEYLKNREPLSAHEGNSGERRQLVGDGSELVVMNLTKLSSKDSYKCEAINSVGAGGSSELKFSVNCKFTGDRAIIIIWPKLIELTS